MTDRDPAARPRTARPSPAGTPTRRPRPAEPVTGTALRDRWWWSPTLSIVIGLVVIGYQLEPLRGPDAIWGNWVVAGLGLAVAVWGAVRLVRAARSR